MMCSGQLLEEKVKKFCKNNDKDEGYIWQAINNIHIKQFGRNIMWEKKQHEKENNIGDIPMAQFFAKCQIVSNAIEIIKGLEKCINNGWELS